MRDNCYYYGGFSLKGELRLWAAHLACKSLAMRNHVRVTPPSRALPERPLHWQSWFSFGARRDERLDVGSASSAVPARRRYWRAMTPTVLMLHCLYTNAAGNPNRASQSPLRVWLGWLGAIALMALALCAIGFMSVNWVISFLFRIPFFLITLLTSILRFAASRQKIDLNNPVAFTRLDYINACLYSLVVGVVAALLAHYVLEACLGGLYSSVHTLFIPVVFAALTIVALTVTVMTLRNANACIDRATVIAYPRSQGHDKDTQAIATICNIVRDVRTETLEMGNSTAGTCVSGLFGATTAVSILEEAALLALNLLSSLIGVVVEFCVDLGKASKQPDTQVTNVAHPPLPAQDQCTDRA